MEEPDFPYPIQKNNTKLKWIVLISLAFIGLVGATFIFREPQKVESKKVVAESVKTIPVSNTPTTKPNKVKANVTIQVLNGTGVPGQAGLVVKALEDAGYSLKNIESGNADSTNSANTTITSRADFEDIVIHIKEILKPMFPEMGDGVINSNPNEDSGFDVIIVTGGSATPIVSPTINL